MTYSVDENYSEDIKTTKKTKSFLTTGITIYDQDGNLVKNHTGYYTVLHDEKDTIHLLEKGEIYIGYELYNKFFKTAYDASTYTDFEPHNIIIKQHEFNDANKKVLAEREFKIKKLICLSVIL